MQCLGDSHRRRKNVSCSIQKTTTSFKMRKCCKKCAFKMLKVMISLFNRFLNFRTTKKLLKYLFSPLISNAIFLSSVGRIKKRNGPEMALRPHLAHSCSRNSSAVYTEILSLDSNNFFFICVFSLNACIGVRSDIVTSNLVYCSPVSFHLKGFKTSCSSVQLESELVAQCNN